MHSPKPEGAHVGQTHHAQPSSSSAQRDGRGDEPKLPCLRDTWAELLRPWWSSAPTPALPITPSPSYLPSDKDVEADPVELEQASGLHT